MTRSSPTCRRRLLPALVGGLAALLLAGCATPAPGAPPQIGPGVAAVVGDRAIPSQTLADGVRGAAPALALAADQEAVSRGEPATGVDANQLAARSRSVLNSAILSEVIAEASRREGIVVPPEVVDAQLAEGGAEAAAAAGFDPETYRGLVADQAAAAELGRRQFDRLAITADLAVLPDRASAERVADQLAADPGPGPLAALPPDSRALGVTLRPGELDQDGRPRGGSLLFGLPAGTVSVSSPQDAPEPGAAPVDPTTQPWTVVRVTDRTLDAPPPGPDVVAGALVDTTSMIQFGLRAIQPLTFELGVQVNPRYGTWDPSLMEVVAPPAAAGTVRPAAVAPAPALPTLPAQPALPVPPAQPTP